jgi:membrane-bound serine protease (ClpP class)
MVLASFIGLVALICLYLEFFLPGGIFALCAFVLMLGSFALFFWQASAFWLGAVYVVAFITLAILTSILALKTVRRSKGSFFLANDQEGYVSTSFEEDLTGKEGVVTTELKPAGHIRIEGKVYQALSQGDFIVKETVVEVVSTKGSHLIVKVKK